MALPTNTFASPGNAYYAVKGEIVGAQDWYQYPSENGEIQLVDASGTQLLQSIDGNLFYNNELLAKASDIQDIADWSLYPSVATVELAGQNIIQGNNIDISGTLTSGAVTASGVVSGGTLATVAGPFTPGNVKTQTVTASGLVSAGSVSASGNIQGNSLTTTGGLDMTNSSITRASSVNISNSGFAPYGSLTSPDGVQLTWNGAAITTGAGGNASQWANYNAVTTVNCASNNITNVGTITAAVANATDATIGTMSLGRNQITGSSATPMILKGDDTQSTQIMGGSITETSTTGDIAITSYNDVTIDSGNDISLTADGGINPTLFPKLNLISKNGSGGQINITSDPALVAPLPGVVNITANGGTISIPNPPPAPPTVVTVGGLINIDANTGSYGLYTASSAIKMSAAGVNIYAGAIPSVGSLAGYLFQYGMSGVSICAGLPSSGFQFPFTLYLYGVGVPGSYGGVRLQSPNGIQMLSDTYMTNLYPLDTDGLTIAGRSYLGTGSVYIEDVQNFTMNGGAALETDNLSSVSGAGILYTDNFFPSNNTKGIFANFVKPIQATAAGVPNLVISNNPFLGVTNYVEISGADVIAFDATGSGKLLGVQSINNAPWPPPTGDASLWSQYPSTSVIDCSGLGLKNVGDLSGVVNINGSAYPPAVSSDDWYLYPSLGTVDISNQQLINVNNIGFLDNGTIISAGQLSIFADTSSGNINIATNAGGNVNIGTGNAGSIFIQTLGAGNDLSLAGDTTSITAAVKLTVDTPIIDVVGADIQNVSNITNEATNLLTVQSTANLIVSAETALTLVSDSADVTVQGQTGILVYAATGDVSLTADSGEVIVQDSLLNMNNHKIANLTAGTAGTDAVNYTQLTFRDSTEFFVSEQGSDTSGNGSILAPYQTIQAAITAAELISSAAQVCVINVASGHYTENLTFSRGYICLNGSLQSQTGNEVCEITGNINIAVTGTPSDLFNRQITFTGFNLTCGAGQTITNTSTTPHIVSFQDCKCFVVNQFYVSTGAFSDGRLYLTNVEIQQTLAGSTSPVIVTNLGQVELERVDIALSGNCSALVIGGTSILSRFSLSALETTNTAATLAPMLSFTSSTTSTHTMGNVAYAISSATAKSNTSAVYIASGVNTTLLMLNNVFSLQGTSASTNYTVGFDGSGTPAILGINNTSLNVNVLLPQTTAVQTGITQIAYTDMNPPNMACYSTTGDQSIAAVNTPQAVTFNTTQFQQGTALVATTRFYVSSQGNYQITWSLCFSHSSGTALMTSFLKKNGTTVANTGSQTTSFSGSSSLVQVSPNFILSLNAGDYVELWVASNALGSTINSTGAINGNPATPGAVFNITQIR